MPVNRKPDISVVVPTLAREDVLFDSLDSMIKCKGSKEIILVGRFPEGMRSRLDVYRKNFPFVRYHDVDGDISMARNFGADDAKADIFVFTDDDVIVPEDWLVNGLAQFGEDSNLAVLSGPGIVPEKDSPAVLIFGHTLASIAIGPMRNRYILHKAEYDDKGSKVIGCNLFVRKKAFEEAGKFDSKIIPGEELYFTRKVIQKGYKVKTSPGVYIYHRARSTPRKFAKQIFRYGKTRAMLIRTGFTADLLQVYALLASLPLLLLMLVFQQKLFVLLFSAYFVFCTLIAVSKAVSTKKLVLLLLAATIPLMHISYLAGLISGFRKGS